MCECCAGKQKRIRVLESDLQFETKRLREDQAQYLVSLEQGQQRETRRLQQKYYRERIDREEDNKKWMQKYDSTVLHHSSQLTRLQEQHRQSLQQTLLHLESQSSSTSQQISLDHARHIDALTEQHKAQIQSLHLLHQQQIAAINQEWDTKNHESLKNAQDHYYLQLKEQINSYDAIVKAKAHEISSLELALNNIKIKQERIYTEFNARGIQIQSLKKQLFTVKYELEKSIQSIQEKEEEIAKIKQINILQMEEMKNALETKITKTEKELNKKILQIREKELKQCEDYQRTIKQIEQKQQIQAQMLRTNLSEMKAYLQSRPSKTEDVEAITNLKRQLQQSVKDYNCVVEEAKEYRLELQNKEETFNRMFVSSASGSSGNIFRSEADKKNKLKRVSIKNSLLNKQLYSFSSTNNMISLQQQPDRKDKNPYFTKTAKII